MSLTFLFSWNMGFFLLWLLVILLQGCSQPKEVAERRSSVTLADDLIGTSKEPTVVELLMIYANEERWSLTATELEEAINKPISLALSALEDRNIFPAPISLNWPKIVKLSLEATKKDLRWSIATARSDRDDDEKYFDLPLTRRRESFSEPLSSLLAAARLILQVQARPQLFDDYNIELSRLMERINAVAIDRQRASKSTAFFALVALCKASNASVKNCFTEALDILVGQKIIVNHARYTERNRVLLAVVSCAKYELTMSGEARIRGIENVQIVHKRLVELAKLYSGNMPKGVDTLEERDLKATTEICF